MGKLGGRERNFSSDIDLIFCHGDAGDTDGARRISNDEYFVRLAQDVQRLLATVTEDGFVFRVDLMLGPFGSAGALSAATAALEESSDERRVGRECVMTGWCGWLTNH